MSIELLTALESEKSGIRKALRAAPNLKPVDYFQTPTATHEWTEDDTTTLPNPVFVSLFDQYPLGSGGLGTPALIIDNGGPGQPTNFIRAKITTFLRTDAQVIELRERPDGFNSCFHVIADDVMVLNVTDAPAFDGVIKRCVITFPSRLMRDIELVGMAVPPDQIIINATDSVELPDTTGPVAIVTGDSFSEGSGAVELSLGLGMMLPKMLGIRKVLVSALGGTGYIGTALGARKDLAERLDTDVVPYPADFFFHMNGVNDSGAGDLLANATSVFDRLDVSHPKAMSFVFAGFNPRNSLPQGVIDDILEAASGRGSYVAFDPKLLNEITGTGDVGTPQNDGNSDWVTSADGTHPSPEGHMYLARVRSKNLASYL